MATDTYFAQSGDALPGVASNKCYVLKAVVDFGDYLTNSGKGDFASGDVAKIWDIPAGTYIDNVIAKVTTAEGATLTVDVGDYVTSNGAAADADGWLNDLNCNTTLPTVSKTSDGSSLGYYTGKLYTTDSWIGLLANNAADAAVIELYAICFDCS